MDKPRAATPEELSPIYALQDAFILAKNAAELANAQLTSACSALRVACGQRTSVTLDLDTGEWTPNKNLPERPAGQTAAQVMASVVPLPAPSSNGNHPARRLRKRY